MIGCVSFAEAREGRPTELLARYDLSLVGHFKRANVSTEFVVSVTYH